MNRHPLGLRGGQTCFLVVLHAILRQNLFFFCFSAISSRELSVCANFYVFSNCGWRPSQPDLDGPVFWIYFFLSFLTRKKQDQALPSQVHWKIWPIAINFLCAQLPGESWRWCHDNVKLCIVNICNQSKVRAEAEVFGRFQDLLPPHLFDQGGGLHHGRQRVGLTPDLLLRIPTS